MISPSEDRNVLANFDFRTLIENSYDFVVLADENNVALYASPAIEHTLGYKPEEFVGTVISDYGHPDEAEAALKRIVETLPIPGPQTLGTWRYRCKDGLYRWLEVVVNNKLGDPSLRGIVCNCRDVTDRIETEEKLRETEERFRGLVEHAHDFIVLASEENVALYASPSLERIMGYTPEEFVGTVIAGYIHPDDLEAGIANVAESLAISGPHTLDTIRYVHKDGSLRWLEVVVNNQVENPSLGGVVCNCRDVTERVEAEEKLRESEEFHRAVNENALDFVVVQRADNTLAYASPSVERLLGWKPEEVVGKKGADFIHPEDLQWAWPLFYEQLQNPQARITEAVNIRYRHKDGRWRWFESACNNQMNNPVIGGLIFNCRDITERVEAEEEIRRLNSELEQRVRDRTARLRAAVKEARNNARMLGDSEERFRLLADGAVEGISLSENGMVFDANDSFSAMFGYEPDEVVGRNVSEFLAPEHRREAEKRISSGDTRTYEAYGLKKDGSVFPVQIRPKILPFSGRNVRAASVLDLTERLESEAALRNSEELYRTVIEQAAESVFLADPESKRILQANSAFWNSLGYNRRDSPTLTLSDIEVLDGVDLDERVGRIRHEGRFTGETQYKCLDGSLLDVEVSATTISYGSGEALCTVAHDVTERKNIEAGLRRSLDMLLALHEAGRVLSSTLDLEEISPKLLEIMQRVSSLTAAVIHVRDDNRKWHIWNTIGPDEAWRAARRSPEAIAARWMSLQTGTHRLFQMKDHETPYGLCLPLRVLNRVVGVLEVYGPESLSDSETTKMLRSLSGQAASAFENARLYRELSNREQRLQELVGKILVAQEEERRRVAYEVHDGLAQVASATHQHLQAYARRYPAESEAARGDLDHILKLVRQTVSDARLVISNLRPTALDDLGLAAALSLKVAEMRDAGWQIEYRESLGIERLPSTVETAFYRVAQEALNNVVKHAGTPRVYVSLSLSAGFLKLRVQDWGCGFDPGEPVIDSGPGERIGLSGMRERVVLTGGVFGVESSPGGGTVVHAETPIVREREKEG